MSGSVDDMKALKMALILHQKGKTLIKKDMFKEALDVIIMAKAPFVWCNHNSLIFWALLYMKFSCLAKRDNIDYIEHSIDGEKCCSNGTGYLHLSFTCPSMYQ